MLSESKFSETTHGFTYNAFVFGEDDKDNEKDESKRYLMGPPGMGSLRVAYNPYAPPGLPHMGLPPGVGVGMPPQEYYYMYGPPGYWGQNVNIANPENFAYTKGFQDGENYKRKYHHANTFDVERRNSEPRKRDKDDDESSPLSVHSNRSGKKIKTG